ncbi:MAG TPA: PIG-L family deacetylase, partial [Rhodothermales bacterium]|nr:PIG-L family deacetylase [Rhodothermales bacterium]
MRLALYLFLVVFLSACAVEAQQAPSQTKATQPDTLQAPRPLVMMNLAAHPDDEDGTTMAYYRHAKNAIVHSVVFTRGEGGQNEIGPELYEALGAIRSDETERAARHLGTQVHFLNFSDFGYSKMADEAFELWGGRDRVTARLVYLIRKLKPDVLFTNHDTLTTGPNRQHGQHQAVGIAAYDAFELAADPTYHPEQLEEEDVDLWQPKRLFLRHWRSSESDDVQVPVGEVLASKGISAAALA